MREIKFRVWDKREHIMINPSEFVLPMPCMSESDLWIIMQYTGLKDKNGKEIYEGDIIHESLIIYEVIWTYQGCFVGKDKNNAMIELYLIENKEIIGNVYENPDFQTF